MATFILLLRGINVGGKNRVPMAELRACLEELEFTDVRTYIASGNVIASSKRTKAQVREVVERELPRRFRLDAALVKVLVLTPAQLRRRRRSASWLRFEAGHLPLRCDLPHRRHGQGGVGGLRST